MFQDPSATASLDPLRARPLCPPARILAALAAITIVASLTSHALAVNDLSNLITHFDTCQQTEPPDFHGPVNPIDQLDLHYAAEHPQLPPTDQLGEIPVQLGLIDDVYTAPREDVTTVSRTIDQLNERGVENYDTSALQHILITVQQYMSQLGYEAVHVDRDPLQMDQFGRDLRPQDQQDLRVLIFVGRVTELRTLAAGDRFADQDNPVDLPQHRFMREISPVQPHDPDDPDQVRRDLPDARQDEEFARRLSRHPGREVEVIRSPGEQISSTHLDYLVTEGKPWAVYAQLSNTGTQGTSRWRQSYGFFHNQLTNRDDILSLQYTTGDFSDVHAVDLSYETPLDPGRYIRFRPSFRYQEFTASDVGILDFTFEGRSWQADGELTANFFQHGSLFLDAVAGVRYWDIRADQLPPQPFPDDRGREQFLLPRLGLTLEQDAGWFSNHVSTAVEFHAGGLTGVDQNEMDSLGRVGADQDWAVLRAQSTHSFFIEPLLFPGRFDDPDTSTLANEIAIRTAGQYAFDNRLIPHAQQVAGGMRTVRGYREAVTRGDNVIIGTLEYRFYLPRLLDIDEEPREIFGEPFRFRPQYVQGPTDWDLSLRTFVDAAYVHTNNSPFDADTLLSTGVGMDLSFRQNARLALDWGIVLSDTEDQRNEVGSNRLHAVLTVMY